MTNASSDAADRAALFNARIARWEDRLATTTLSTSQSDGWACVACGRNWLTDRTAGPAVPIGFGPHGQVFVCESCDQPGEVIA